MEEQHYFNLYYSSRDAVHTDVRYVSAFYAYPGIMSGSGYLGSNLDEAVDSILGKLEGVPPTKIRLKSDPPSDDEVFRASTPLTSRQLTQVIQGLSERRKDMTFVRS